PAIAQLGQRDAVAAADDGGQELPALIFLANDIPADRPSACRGCHFIHVDDSLVNRSVPWDRNSLNLPRIRLCGVKPGEARCPQQSAISITSRRARNSRS